MDWQRKEVGFFVWIHHYNVLTIKGEEGIMSKKRRMVWMRKAKELFSGFIVNKDLAIGLYPKGLQHFSPTVYECPNRASRSNLDFATLLAMDVESIGRILYPEKAQRGFSKTDADMAYLHKELKRKGIALQLLWEEHKASHPEGYNRS